MAIYLGFNKGRKSQYKKEIHGIETIVHHTHLQCRAKRLACKQRKISDAGIQPIGENNISCAKTERLGDYKVWIKILSYFLCCNHPGHKSLNGIDNCIVQAFTK